MPTRMMAELAKLEKTGLCSPDGRAVTDDRTQFWKRPEYRVGDDGRNVIKINEMFGRAEMGIRKKEILNNICIIFNEAPILWNAW